MRVTVQSSRSLVSVLALCELSDLAAVPVLLSDDTGAPRAAIGVAVAALGLATAVAVAGLTTGARWGRPAAWATRLGDVALATGAVAAGRVIATAAAAALALSVAAIVQLVRSRPARAVVSGATA